MAITRTSVMLSVRLKATICMAACISIAPLFLSGCSGERENDPPVVTDTALATWVAEITAAQVTPAFTDFASASSDLEASVITFCAEPGVSTLEPAQANWETTMMAWYRLLPFNFGPLTADAVFPAYSFIDSFRVRGTDYLASVQSDINGWMNAAAPFELNTATLPFQKTGLLMVEALLYSSWPDQFADQASIAAGYVSNARLCELLEAHTAQLVLRADTVVAAWSAPAGFAEQLRTDTIADGTPALTAILATVQGHLDFIASRTAATRVTPLAQIGWPLMSETMNAVERLLDGNNPTNSLFELMIGNGADIAVSAIKGQIQLAREAISAQDSVTFQSAIQTLDGQFKREIPNGLEVQLGINFSDGD